MTFSMNRLLAIAGKEWKDSLRNPQILLNAGMPVVLAILMKGRTELAEVSAMSFTVPIMIAIAIVGAFAQALMISEEKEKHTLRALMLSPASPAEVLLGKSAMTALFTIAVMAVCMLITGVPGLPIGLTALLVLFMLTIFMAFGTTIGLLSRTVGETSIAGLPIVLLFVFGPLFGPGLKVTWVAETVGYLPSFHFMEALSELARGGSIGDIRWSVVNLAAWTVLSVGLCLLVYARKRFDK